MPSRSPGDEASKPRPRELASLLGRSNSLWSDLKIHLGSTFDPLTEKWSYSAKGGRWYLQLRRKKRTVLYLIPCQGYFLAAFTLGEKAVRAAHDSDLSESILAVIDGARRYAEGRAVRIEVRTKRDLRNVEKLAGIKMAH